MEDTPGRSNAKVSAQQADMEVSTPAVPVYSQCTHITTKYHSFVHIEGVRESEGNILIVPQKVYKASGTDSGFTQRSVIKFSQNGKRGIYMKDALQENFLQINDDEGATEPVELPSSSQKGTIRLEVR